MPHPATTVTLGGFYKREWQENVFPLGRRAVDLVIQPLSPSHRSHLRLRQALSPEAMTLASSTISRSARSIPMTRWATCCASIRKAPRPRTARNGAPGPSPTIHSHGCSRPTTLSREPSLTHTTPTAGCYRRPRPRPTRLARPPRSSTTAMTNCIVSPAEVMARKAVRWQRPLSRTRMTPGRTPKAI